MALGDQPVVLRTLRRCVRQWRRGIAHLRRRQPLATLAFLWPHIRPGRRLLWAAAAVTLTLTAVETATPLLVGAFVGAVLDELGEARSSFSAAWDRRGVIALLIAGAFARGALLAQQRALTGRIGQQVAAHLRAAVWTHLQRLPVDYTRRQGAGRLLLRFVGDSRAVQRLVTEGLVQLVQDVLLGGAVALALAVINWRMALAALAVLPVYAVLFRRLNPALQRASRATRRRRSRLSAYLTERIAGMALVKAHGRQQVETAAFKALSRSVARHGTRQAAVGGRLHGLAAAAVAAGGAAVLVIAAGEATAGRLTAGGLVAFYTLLGLLLPILQRTVTVNRHFQEALVSVQRLAALRAERRESPQDRARPPLVVRAGEVAIEHVSLRYGDRPPVLDDASLLARRGEVVVLLGPNGAGKTTLLELLLRFRQPSSGRVLIDGQDIANVSLASLRSHIGFVAQDAPILEGTIAENLVFGLRNDCPAAPLAPHEQIEQPQVQAAVRLAGLDRLVAALPDGWATPVVVGGRALSHGQRQRIALARALAADPSILVLDEPCAALDGESAQLVAAMLRLLAQRKTIIVATSRPAAPFAADRIYPLERGRTVAVEPGPPAPPQRSDDCAPSCPTQWRA